MTTLTAVLATVYSGCARIARLTSSIFTAVLTHTLVPSKAVDSTYLFTRNDSDALALTNEGLVQVEADESRHVGARRVKNYAVSPIENYFFGVGSLGEYVADPFGGMNAKQLICDNLGDLSLFVGETVSGYSQVIVSFWARSPDIPLVLPALGGNFSTTDVNVTTEWQRFSLPAIYVTGGTAYVGTTGGVFEPNQIIEVYGWQLEDILGKVNQNPSEYVSVGVGTGTQILNDPDFNTPAVVGEETDDLTIGLGCSVSDGFLNIGEFSATSGSARLLGETIAGKTYLFEYEIIGGDAFGVSMLGITLPATEGVHSVTGVNITPSGGLTISSLVAIQLPYFRITECDHGSNVDGVKYFNSTNPNTVDGNGVVTADATQTLLSDLKGVMLEASSTNLCECKNANPALKAYIDGVLFEGITADLTGAQSALITSYDIAELELAGLRHVCNLGIVYKLTGGNGAQSFGKAVISGLAEAGIATASIYYRTVGVSCELSIGDGALTLPASDHYVRADVTGNTIATDELTISANNSEIIYFILPQLEMLPYATSVIPTNLAATIRNAESLTYPYENLRQTNLDAVNDVVFKTKFTPLTNAVDLGNVGIVFGVGDSVLGNYGFFLNCKPTGELAIRKMLNGAINLGAPSGVFWQKGVTLSVVCRFNRTDGMRMWVNGVDVSYLNNTTDIDLLLVLPSTTDIILGVDLDGTTASSNIIVEQFEVYGDLPNAKCLELSNV